MIFFDFIGFSKKMHPIVSGSLHNFIKNLVLPTNQNKSVLVLFIISHTLVTYSWVSRTRVCKITSRFLHYYSYIGNLYHGFFRNFLLSYV